MQRSVHLPHPPGVQMPRRAPDAHGDTGINPCQQPCMYHAHGDARLDPCQQPSMHHAHGDT
eukprot:365641-Chlamydomonas_euryale.AAC.5